MTDHNAIRLAIAQTVVAERRAARGEAITAAAVYGSVAHGAASAHSDVELTLVLRDDLPASEDHLFVDGVMVECSAIPASQFLAAARRVTWNWGIEADAYRHQRVLWDPAGFYPRLRAAALDLDLAARDRELAASWWFLFERRTKTRGALAAGDAPRAIFSGWDFARGAALTIALHEARPYESFHTIWGDVAARGYAMADLLAALTTSDLAGVAATLEAVWRRVGGWGAPAGGAPA